MSILETKQMINYWLYGGIGAIIIIALAGIRIVRPTERAVKETLGKYAGFGKSGFNWIIPIFQRMIQVNVTERMTDIEPQEIITKDNLNASVDLVVFYEPVPSEIRTIQRRDRTGRLSKGRVVVLMAEKTRDEAFYWVSFHKEKRMHRTLKGMKEEKELKKQTTIGDWK